MSRKQLFYQNISKIDLRSSILASSGLSNSKNYLKNLLQKAGERFVKASVIFNRLHKETERFKIQVYLKRWKFWLFFAMYQNFRKFDKH